MKRLVITLLLAATVVVAGTSLAPTGIANAYPPGQTPVGIRINVVAVRPTETFTVTISPCIPGETVIFRFRDQRVDATCNAGASASATFTPRINPGRGPKGFAPPSRMAQSLVAQAAVEADVPGPGDYEVCGDVTGSGAANPAGVTRPLTLCTSVEVLADSTATTLPPDVTTPGTELPATTLPPGVTAPGGGVPSGELPATGSNGLGTTTTSAIVLISAGALLLIVTLVRRRRTSPATS